MLADITLNAVAICFLLSAVVLGVAAFKARLLPLLGAALFALAFFLERT